MISCLLSRTGAASPTAATNRRASPLSSRKRGGSSRISSRPSLSAGRQDAIELSPVANDREARVRKCARGIEQQRLGLSRELLIGQNLRQIVDEMRTALPGDTRDFLDL